MPSKVQAPRGSGSEVPSASEPGHSIPPSPAARLPSLCWVGQDSGRVFKHELHRVPVSALCVKHTFIGEKWGEWALNTAGWSRQQREVAGSLLGATPAARPQQGALPCLCSALAPWLCHHGFILQTPCTNTRSVCKHHPSLTGEHSPQTPLYPSPGGRSRCQPLSEAHPAPVPPSLAHSVPSGA